MSHSKEKRNLWRCVSASKLSTLNQIRISENWKFKTFFLNKLFHLPVFLLILQRKMVRVGAQTPVYEQINEPNVSEDEDVIYHRARSPVYSINTTYEQPIPVYQNRPRPRDQTYYNVKPKDSSDNKNITKHVDRSSLSPVPQVIETYEELSRQNTPKDDIYYNESLSTSRNYPEPSPVSHRSQGSHRPSPPFSLQVELPGVDEAQRVGTVIFSYLT